MIRKALHLEIWRVESGEPSDPNFATPLEQTAVSSPPQGYLAGNWPPLLTLTQPCSGAQDPLTDQVNLEATPAANWVLVTLLEQYWGLQHRCKFRWLVGSQVAINWVNFVMRKDYRPTSHPDTMIICQWFKNSTRNSADLSSTNGSRATKILLPYMTNYCQTPHSMLTQMH